MDVLVVGTGALACLFAGRLVRSGNDVSMLGSWQEGLAALRQRGVRLLEMDGSTSQYPVEVLEGANGNERFRQALVLVKSWQTAQVARQLTGYLSDDGIALTLQNGSGNYEILQEALGKDRVALGVTTVGAMMLEPGYVRHSGEGKVSLGAQMNLGNLGEVLSASGFEVEMVDDLAGVEVENEHVHEHERDHDEAVEQFHRFRILLGSLEFPKIVRGRCKKNQRPEKAAAHDPDTSVQANRELDPQEKVRAEKRHSDPRHQAQHRDARDCTPDDQRLVVAPERVYASLPYIGRKRQQANETKHERREPDRDRLPLVELQEEIAEGKNRQDGERKKAPLPLRPCASFGEQGGRHQKGKTEDRGQEKFLHDGAFHVSGGERQRNHRHHRRIQHREGETPGCCDKIMP